LLKIKPLELALPARALIIPQALMSEEQMVMADQPLDIDVYMGLVLGIMGVE